LVTNLEGKGSLQEEGPVGKLGAVTENIVAAGPHCIEELQKSRD